jgi:hypothetical protein
LLLYTGGLNLIHFWSENPTANWQVPLISQTTVKLRWEACARMMWQWHYKNFNGYASKAGDYSKLDKGLSEEEMDLFYKQLGPQS